MTSKYLVRDISWMAFNTRVLDETDKNIPIAEKLLFYGITHSNLEEFLMARYPAILFEDINNIENIVTATKNNYSTIGERFEKFNDDNYIIASLTDILNQRNLKYFSNYFKSNIYPVLLPMTVSMEKTADIRNKEIYIYVETEDIKDETNTHHNFIQVPDILERFIAIPEKEQFITIEELIVSNLSMLLNGMRPIRVGIFRVLRNAEVIIRDDGLDQYKMIERMIKEREKSWITAVEFGLCTDKQTKDNILSFLNTTENTIKLSSDFIRMSDLKSIGDKIFTNDKDKMRKLKPKTPLAFRTEKSVFDIIKSGDQLVYHPFESFKETFVRFMKESAEDKDVISIKISLYRVADKSEIIDALLKAAENGKYVTVMVELKARFDEKHNILVSNILKEAGVNIVYGTVDLKTHAKICLVTRRENNKTTTYCHVGTGNYNESNAKLYTDYSYFTARKDLGKDLTAFFNLLTSSQQEFKSREIIYAPHNMRKLINEYIDDEIKKSKRGEKGRIIFKCNSLTDDKIASKLYDASNAGVEIILIVRGACIIRPNVKGLSENIKIYSIIGRFLEHSRIYIFGKGKNKIILIGSSDIMHRNLNTRNELLLNVKDENIRHRIMSDIHLYLSDNVNRRIILDNYKYKEVRPGKGEDAIDSHQQFIKMAKK